LSIIFAPEAEADLCELLDYVADRNPQAAVELEERIFGIIERLAVREMEGPEQRLRTGQIVKSWPVPPVRIARACRPIPSLNVHSCVYEGLDITNELDRPRARDALITCTGSRTSCT